MNVDFTKIFDRKTELSQEKFSIMRWAHSVYVHTLAATDSFFFFFFLLKFSTCMRMRNHSKMNENVWTNDDGDDVKCINTSWIC